MKPKDIKVAEELVEEARATFGDEAAEQLRAHLGLLESQGVRPCYDDIASAPDAR